MAKKSLKCPKCDRTFSMPAHLARHTSTIHGVKARPKAAAKRRSKRKIKARPARRKTGAKRRAVRSRTAVSAPGLSVGQHAARLVADMQAYHSELLDQRAALDGEIAGIASAMSALGKSMKAPATRKARAPRRGRAGRRRGRTAGRKIRAGSLTDYVVKVLRQKARPMSPGEISKAVVRAGYKSSAKDLAKAVSNTLAKVKQVRRVGRGMYRL